MFGSIVAAFGKFKGEGRSGGIRGVYTLFEPF